MDNIKIQLANDHHLQQIIDLSTLNNKKNLSLDQQSDGFTTAEYSLEFLQRLHIITPAIVALDVDRVVGYVLVVPKELAGGHPLLLDFVSQIQNSDYRDFSTINYIVVGQLCVAKDYRGKGLVQKLYSHLECAYQSFDSAITDVDQRNSRSKKAHYKSGWKPFGDIVYDGIPFELIIKEFQK
ncbi:hypothetical protein HDV06_005681 [Boothiomyces sp. JEL0866]|nr:hypothetical protein HDV06_005681 [Boothiomyces sp. JEL0866]